MPPLFPKSYIPQANTYNPAGTVNPATGQPYVYGGAPVAPAATPPASSFLASNNNSNIVSPAETPTTPSTTRSPFIDPKTGKYFATAKDYANYVATKIPIASDVPKYAGDQMMNPNQTAEQLTKTAAGLNNARNDIATGTTDPYGVGNKSGIAYSPTELAAIEKAYAGVYDPALQDVFAKLKIKQDADLAAQDLKTKLELMAKQHQYDLELKATPTAAEALAGSQSQAGGNYIPGEDPVVDSYVNRINRGELATDVFRSIPGVKNQALRDKISVGINSTRYEAAKAVGSLDTINQVNKLLSNPALSHISGPVGQWAGGIFGKAATAKTIFEQVAAQLQVQGAALAKGQGQISDYERTIFRDAAVGMTRGMSDAEFRQALVNMRGALSVASGLTATTKLTDTDTGESKTYELNREQIIEAEKMGAMVEFVE